MDCKRRRNRRETPFVTIKAIMFPPKKREPGYGETRMPVYRAGKNRREEKTGCHDKYRWTILSDFG